MKTEKISNVYIYLTLVLFVLAIVWGYFTFQDQFDGLDSIKNVFSSYGFFQNISPLGLFLFIFINNALKSFMAVILGIALGLFPLYFLYINGILLGATISLAYTRAGLLVVIAGLVPHGIFEIPALIIAISYGIWLGVRTVLGVSKKAPLKPAFQRAMSIYFKVVLPLLFIGAIIEAFVTPILLNKALGQ